MERTRETLDDWFYVLNRKQARKIATRKVYSIFSRMNGLRPLHHEALVPEQPVSSIKPFLLSRLIRANRSDICQTLVLMRENDPWLRQNLVIRNSNQERELAVFLPGTILPVEIRVAWKEKEKSLVQVSIPRALSPAKLHELKTAFSGFLATLKKHFEE